MPPKLVQRASWNVDGTVGGTSQGAAYYLYVLFFAKLELETVDLAPKFETVAF